MDFFFNFTREKTGQALHKPKASSNSANHPKLNFWGLIHNPSGVLKRLGLPLWPDPWQHIHTCLLNLSLFHFIMAGASVTVTGHQCFQNCKGLPSIAVGPSLGALVLPQVRKPQLFPSPHSCL